MEERDVRVRDLTTKEVSGGARYKVTPGTSDLVNLSVPKELIRQ